MRFLVLATAAAACLAGAAQAQERPPADPMTSAPVTESDASKPSEVIEAAELAEMNGRQGSSSTILSEQDLTAVNCGNTVTANTVGSGQITLGPGAFDGFAGVGNFVINSGHNNNLQGALTINIVSPQ